jgi:hypothetical protein
VDGPPLWEQTSTVWALSFVKIDVWQFEWLLMNVMNVRSAKCLYWIWTREMWVQRWFQKIVIIIKKRAET